MEASPPLVILHGWGHSKKAWKSVLDKFDAERVLVLDLPGFGEEILQDATWGVPEYADWVERKIEAMKLENVVLLGHSFGGRIAALIASRHPKWLAKLILYGAPVLYRPSASVKFRIALAKTVKPFLKKQNSGNAQLDHADKKELGTIFRKVVPFDQTSGLPKISVPTLLIWGEHDEESLLPIAEEAKMLIPGSRLEVMQGVGHNAHMDNPTLFCGIVNRFSRA